MSLGVDLYNMAEEYHAKSRQKILNSTGFSEVAKKLKEAAKQGKYSCILSAVYIERWFGEDVAIGCDFFDAWRSVGINVVQRFVYGKEVFEFDWGIE